MNLIRSMGYGIRNLRAFGPVVWRFRGWDFAHLLELMATAAREMRRSHEPGITVDAPRIAAELRSLEEACRRLCADEYAEAAGYDHRFFPTLTAQQQRDIFERAEAMAQEDQTIIGLAFQRVRCWWN